MMKILHISNYYYPHLGGIEQVARDAVGAMKGQCEQKVFCFNHEKGNSRGEVDGVEVIRAGCFAKVASQSLSFGYKKLLKRTMEEFCPDVVLFHFPNPFGAHYLLKLLKKWPGCKLIIYYHLDITKQKILGKLFKGQTRRLTERAAKVLATSPVYAGKSPVLSRLGEKCTVVPLCVDSARMTASPADYARAEEIRSSAEGKTVLFAVGRHVPYKGIEYLVRASKLLGEQYKIFIGGKGPLTDSLKKLAEGDGKITFLGALKEEELRAYYIAADIFCFPSVTKNEAFGIALAEAMSFGKPAVTFHIEGSGVNFVSLDGVTGLEAENANVQAYAAAIEKLASDKSLREQFGRAAAERVENNFTPEKFAGGVRAAFKGL